MRHIEPKDATLLAAVLATESTDLRAPGYYEAAKHAEHLIRLGKRARRIAEQQCNGIQRYDVKAGCVLESWTEADEARAEKAKERIRREADAILSRYGWNARVESVSGDPRGRVLKIRLASGRSNGMDSGVWGI